MPAYSRLVDPIGCHDFDESRQGVAWCRRLAFVTLLAALFAGALVLVSMHDRDALSPAGTALAAAAYASFAAVVIMRWPQWLPVAVTTAGAVASTDGEMSDVLVFPGLVAAVAAFSVCSERTPAVAAAIAVIGVLLSGRLASLARLGTRGGSCVHFEVIGSAAVPAGGFTATAQP
jgi:hypothetical protein